MTSEGTGRSPPILAECHEALEPVQAGATLGGQHLSDTRVDLGMVVQPRDRQAQAATEDLHRNRPYRNETVQGQQSG